MQCRLTIFSFELSLKVFPDVQDKVPNHDEWKSQEQSQSSPHLSKERLERIDQNLLVDLHITSRVGEAKNGLVSVMCFTIEKILELFKQELSWVHVLLTWLLIYSVYLQGILQPVSLNWEARKNLYSTGYFLFSL